MDEVGVDPATLPRRIHDPLGQWATTRPDAPAFVAPEGRTLSYRALRDAVSSLASVFAAAGVRGGDRIVIVNENTPTAAIGLFAASRLDAWAVVVNARLAAAEIDRICDHARPRLIFVTHSISPEANAHADRYRAVEAGVPVVGSFRMATRSADEPEPIEQSNAQVAALIYTSGTTGEPKGVMLTHRSVSFTAATAGGLRAMGGDDFIYQVVPISHVFGFASVLVSALHAGARIALVPRFDPAGVADALEAGITIFQGVPLMFAKLLEYLDNSGRPLRAPQLRYISAGGSPLDVDRKRQVERRFGLPLNNGYGITECTSNVALTRSDEWRDDDSVSRPVPGVTVRFVGTDGVDVPEGDVGEAWVRGPNVMKGYYRDQAATEAAVTGGGWFRTGDLGFRAVDGRLFIAGRCRELIIRSGFNVYPAEIESVLNGHPAVAQSAVIGRKVAGNEEVVAFVEARAGSEIAIAALRDHVRARLAPYKRPQHIFILKQLPVNPNGKVVKPALSPLAEQLLADKDGS
jgi:acyl-CoA synthetase (AMP-forming)/AMP-acid ligase II